MVKVMIIIFQNQIDAVKANDLKVFSRIKQC